MTRQSMFQAKKESQPLQTSFLFRRQAAQAPVEEREAAALPVNLGRDFSAIPFKPVHPAPALGPSSISCPFTPQRCPFGGACHACPPKMQAKLKIGQPGDRYEQEADRVAEQVMRMPEPQVQRKGCSAPGCKDEDEKKLLQTKPANAGEARAQVDHPLIQSVLASPGQPLDAGTRSFMEPRFGQDFSGVRVHVGGKAAESARAVNARAYTVGQNVVFGEGQYAPGSGEGRRLMAHELVHVGQQSYGLLIGANLVQRSLDAYIKAMQEKPEPDWKIAAVHLNGESPKNIKIILNNLSEHYRAKLHEAARNWPGLCSNIGRLTEAEYLKEHPETIERVSGVCNKTPEPEAIPKKPTKDASEVSKNIASAATQLPTRDTGAPMLRFGQSMEEDGYLYNPKYWVVDYILIKNDQRKIFSSSEEHPSAWKLTVNFLKSNSFWHGSKLDINIRLGKAGASAAINDVWNPDSATNYAIDCLGAATLIQLRGIYLSYPSKDRDAAFNRDYAEFNMQRFGGDQAQLPTSSINSDMDVTKLSVPIPLSDPSLYEKIIQPGDQIPVLNRYMPESSAWRTENVIYIGNMQFFGHPLGVVTLQAYVQRISKHIPSGYVDKEIGRPAPKDEAELKKFVLDNSIVASYARSRLHNIDATVPKKTKAR